MSKQGFDASHNITAATDRLPTNEIPTTLLSGQLQGRASMLALRTNLNESQNRLIESGLLPAVDLGISDDVQLKTSFAVSDGGAGGGTDKPTWTPPSEAEFALAKDGHPVDPINIYMHGTLDELRKALEQAGWSESSDNPINWLINKDKFSVTSLYYEGADGERRSQVASFSRDTNGAFYAERSHLRIFDTGKVDEDGRRVWGIAASFDNGLRNNGGWNALKPWQWAHTKEENTDGARDYVVRTLKDSRYGGHESTLNLPHSARPSTSGDNVVYDIRFGAGPKIIGPLPSPDEQLLT